MEFFVRLRPREILNRFAGYKCVIFPVFYRIGISLSKPITILFSCQTDINPPFIWLCDLFARIKRDSNFAINRKKRSSSKCYFSCSVPPRSDTLHIAVVCSVYVALAMCMSLMSHAVLCTNICPSVIAATSAYVRVCVCVFVRYVANSRRHALRSTLFLVCYISDKSRP